MRRREFIALVGSTAVVWPLATRAQQPAMPLVGFLHVGSPAPMTPQVEGFRKGLAQTGYVVPQNLAIEYRWAEGHYDRLPAQPFHFNPWHRAVVVCMPNAALLVFRHADDMKRILANDNHRTYYRRDERNWPSRSQQTGPAGRPCISRRAECGTR
jgi:hypothetical protein